MPQFAPAVFRFTYIPFFACIALLVAFAPPLVLAREPAPIASSAFRPPAVPLIACDPYFSLWSFNDRLTDGPTRHWTGREQRLTTIVRVDGKPYRVMGDEPKDIAAAPQSRLDCLPTRTIYEFTPPGVKITLTFLTPQLPHDLDIFGRPVTYLTADVAATDGRKHDVALYVDTTAEPAVNEPDQGVVWSRENGKTWTAFKIGTESQAVLGRKGDDLRIDWGYYYLAARTEDTPYPVIGDANALRGAFTQGKPLPTSDSALTPPRPANQAPLFALVFSLPEVGAKPVSRTVLFAYDDLYGIQYFGKNLRSYWRRDGMDAAGLIDISFREQAKLAKKCRAFDDELMADLAAVGGDDYARITALACRQCWAGQKLVADANGQPLLFTKECFSNGCIGTVDVLYPAMPQMLFFSRALSVATLQPLLDYAASERWPFPFAPHDLGTYPLANGQIYGGGERTEENQMPVEESANMILAVAALAKIDGNAKFAARHWTQIEEWANYLKEKGLDPENQLCTDDFAGHLAHNANLSIKAIVALEAYAFLCDELDKSDDAKTFHTLAKDYAAQWVALADDGDHFRLAFDKPGTWSQKYNLVWDRVLGFNLFPPDVASKELAYYKTRMGTYGLPLDSRETWTKTDWQIWTASLATDDADWKTLLNPIYRWVSETPDRVPMTDWYRVGDGKRVGFQARPVIGGVFMKMLTDQDLWEKWFERGKTRPGDYAPLPKKPVVRVLAPTAAAKETVLWRYTTQKPTGGWVTPGFNDTTWRQGPAGFGSQDTPGAIVRTTWTTPHIWIRREFTLPDTPLKDPRLRLHHDEDVEVYINGTLVHRESGYLVDYDDRPLSEEAKATLRPGRNTFAVYCHQTVGGQFLDVGLVDYE